MKCLSPAQIATLNFPALGPLNLCAIKALDASDILSLHINTMPLHIIVVGAGLGGLAVAMRCAMGGNKVTVLEAAPKIAEVGNSELEGHH